MREGRARPHTLAFGSYLVAMTAALLIHSSWAYAAFFGGLLAVQVLLTLRATPDPGSGWTIAADAFYPVALNTAFPAMAGAVPAVRPMRFDAALFALDARFLGGSWSLRLEPLTGPVLTEVMSLCYLFFMPLLFFHLVRYFFWRRHLRAGFMGGLFTVYGIGFLGYLLVPAAGPHVAFARLFSTPLEGGFFWHLNHAMVTAGSNGVDVFPSLHTAVSVFILAFAYRHARREFWWLLIPVAGICVSTVYLRYHYLIDVICGLVLAFIGLAAAIHVERRHRVTEREINATRSVIR
ncbi:MAG: hypothetical protein QOI59_6470 [Gammaproteobacteria bacterium]|nr:hypothetical protein [Gammaproteobacteria bacterium]